jgi:hypothetical protein
MPGSKPDDGSDSYRVGSTLLQADPSKRADSCKTSLRNCRRWNCGRLACSHSRFALVSKSTNHLKASAFGSDVRRPCRASKNRVPSAIACDGRVRGAVIFVVNNDSKDEHRIQNILVRCRTGARPVVGVAPSSKTPRAYSRKPLASHDRVGSRLWRRPRCSSVGGGIPLPQRAGAGSRGDGSV